MNSVLVKVDQMFLSNMGFVVLLKGQADPRTLPIFIGAAEAQAIALWINKVEMPRPMTHDLMKNILDCIECRLHRVEICDLKEGTFYARLVLECEGVNIEIDSRPSDAIALALRTQSPLYVSQHVMEQAGRIFEEESTDGDVNPEATPEAPSENPEDVQLHRLSKDLERAVKEERFEDAANLRDEINRIHQKHAKN